MAELLSKEKEFIKLNQHLDRMATSAGGGHEMSVAKTDNRFYTFQKSKGPSTLLRKQGAGDGYAEVADFTNIKKQTANATAHINRVMEGETYRSYEPATSSAQPYRSTNPGHYRAKQNKYSETNRSQTSNRSSTSRVVPPNNSTFTVKYHNPKFLESPSLEVLVKEESSSLRCQTEDLRIGSVGSMATDDGISTGRRSQTSYHTVAPKKNISSEGLIKFLKSKIIILEEDHERISEEMTKQKELLEKTLEHAKTLEQQRDQIKVKNNSLTEQLAKHEKQLEEANKLLKERNMEQNTQHKELETTKRDFKLLTQTNSNLEKRLFKANEDLEGARKALSLMKANERDQMEAVRKESELKDSKIKSLKKQRANLLNAYKKQMFIIDNLKRQNILLEQAKMLDFGEKEFAKVLDWDIKR